MTAAIETIDAALRDLRSVTYPAGFALGPAPDGLPDGARTTTAEAAAAHVGDVVVITDADGRYEWVSPSTVLVTGWRPADVVGRNRFDLIHPEDAALVRDRWAELERGADLVTVEHRLRRPDGSYAWVESRTRALRGPDGVLTGAVTCGRDVTERHRLQTQLLETLEVFELGFTAASIGNALVGADGRWLKVNPALEAITGRTEADLLAATFQDITHPDDLDADLHLVSEVLRGERDGYELEKRYLRPDGSEVWVLLTVAAARHRDGAFRFFVVHVQDISRRKADERELQFRAEHDSLTRLWNRRRLRQELRRVATGGQRRTDHPVLLLLDLDGFKAVNDAWGHDAGDIHLREVAAVLSGAVRAGDGCARLGGDEFAVLLPDAAPDRAEQIARRIGAQIAALGRGTTASIGVAAWNGEENIDQWLVRADREMYAVKHRRTVRGGGKPVEGRPPGLRAAAS